MPTIQDYLAQGFTPDQAIAAASVDNAALVATKAVTTTGRKAQPAKLPATAKQALFYVKSLYNASIKGVKNGDPFAMPVGLKAALKDAASSMSANLPEALEKGQNPDPIGPALVGQVCIWIIKKGARKGLGCGSDKQVIQIDGSPYCDTHAKAVQSLDATAKALNESPDGQGIIQNANINAPEGPETEALL
jgi:hypothetical protein